MPVPKGKRYGGKPKGYKHQKTLEKEAARELARAFITDALRPMLRSHIAHAMGIGHVYTRDKNKKFTKIEDATQIDALLTDGEERKDYWIFTKDPSAHSLGILLDRALDRAKEQTQDVNVKGHLEVVGAALDRIKERNRGKSR